MEVQPNNNTSATPKETEGKTPIFLRVAKVFLVVAAIGFSLAAIGTILLFVRGNLLDNRYFAAGIVNFLVVRGLNQPLMQLIGLLDKLHLVGIFGFLILLLLLVGAFAALRAVRHKALKKSVWAGILGIAVSLAVLVGSSFLLINMVLGGYLNAAFDITENPRQAATIYKESYKAVESDLLNSPAAATVALNKLINDVESGRLNMDSLSDEEYIDLAETVSYLVDAQGGVLNAKQHYFRNYFSRAPKTLDEMIKTIKEHPNNPFGWRLLPPKDTLFHMMGPDGEFNLKFISSDGHFEAVYNKQGELLNAQTGPLNMGTFNYASPQTILAKHAKYDVATYEKWNNIPNQGPVEKNEMKEMQTKFDASPEAKKHYEEVAAQLGVNGIQK